VLSRTDLFLLSLLTLLWGVNWPVMKYAVLTYPPLTFRGISMVLGIVAIALYMMLRKDRFYVPPQERGPILKLVLGNMLIWHLFAIYALKFLTSGRAAIIGYTMPIWAMLIGVLFYKNPLPGGVQWACCLP
jgi:drug/metabolite transporter (DMT)-like permease